MTGEVGPISIGGVGTVSLRFVVVGGPETGETVAGAAVVGPDED